MKNAVQKKKSGIYSPKKKIEDVKEKKFGYVMANVFFRKNDHVFRFFLYLFFLLASLKPLTIQKAITKDKASHDFHSFFFFFAVNPLVKEIKKLLDSGQNVQKDLLVLTAKRCKICR